MTQTDRTLKAMIGHFKLEKWPWTQLLLVLILLACFKGIDELEDIHKAVISVSDHLVDVQNGNSDNTKELRDSIDEVKTATEQNAQ